MSDSKKIIPVLRAENIERVKDDFVILGDWNKHKHKNGPAHYCLISQSRDGIVEIYPLRKSQSTEAIELILAGYEYTDSSISNGVNFDPDGNRLVLLEQMMYDD
ncbi:MAG: hypothetical protein SFT91_06570 [Rickettsiaceae bacterium]|nr:hypothetical protein [Rickettsiaceae bacterium]